MPDWVSLRHEVAFFLSALERILGLRCHTRSPLDPSNVSGCFQSSRCDGFACTPLVVTDRQRMLPLVTTVELALDGEFCRGLVSIAVLDLITECEHDLVTAHCCAFLLKRGSCSLAGARVAEVGVRAKAPLCCYCARPVPPARRSAALGTYESVFDDYRLIRSIGGFEYAEREHVAGALQLLPFRDDDAKGVTRVTKLLKQALTEECETLLTTPPNEEDLLLGVEAIKQLMLSESAGPNTDYLRVRTDIAGPRDRTEAFVRNKENQILKRARKRFFDQYVKDSSVLRAHDPIENSSSDGALQSPPSRRELADPTAESIR